jgi:hypothetical protein
VNTSPGGHDWKWDRELLDWVCSKCDVTAHGIIIQPQGASGDPKVLSCDEEIARQVHES